MKLKTTTGICVTLLAMAIVPAYAKPAPPKPAQVQLSDAGDKLLQKYSSMLAGVKAELDQSMPAIDPQKQAAFLKAIAAERAAAEDVKAKEEAFRNAGNLGLLRHREGWVKKAAVAVKEATQQVEQAQAALKAKNNEENAKALKSAQDRLAKEQANADTGAAELKKCQEAVEKAKQDLPKLEAAFKAAQDAHVEAKAQLKGATALLRADVASVLTRDTLDAKLMKFVILSEATPRGLAAFAQQGPEHEALVDQLLSNDALMQQMLVADGAKDGNYGQAMKIYTAIQIASPKSHGGHYQRLALATALEHATPVAQSNPKQKADAPATVDPVQRYLDYEKASLDGELDSHFKDLTVWDYRMVVDGDEPSETLAWGRKMLRNYRPDLITTGDFRWRYVEAVKTEVKYGSQDVKFDLPTLHPYQNMIMNGGVCGRRAFFGRFILRAFGIPTTARPQPGHAALVHWTPKGWVINLGAGWGSGTTKTRYEKDTDFLSVTQARSAPAYMEVLRAHWIGDLAGENRAYGLDVGKKSPKSGFWNYWAVCRRHQIAEESKAEALAAVGTDIGEANESAEKEVITTVKLSDADRQITVSQDGSITIPAVACSKPTNSTAKIRFMPSSLGGMQLHHGRLGKPEGFEYTIDVPAKGKYMLTARVVTTSPEQVLMLAVNDAKEPILITAPFTVGNWDNTAPVEVALAAGRNVLRFSRPDEVKGLTIKDFTLTPAR